MERGLRFPRSDPYDRRYWLCRCEGFRVEAGGRIRAAVAIVAPAVLALAVVGCGGHAAAPRTSNEAGSTKHASAAQTPTARRCATSDLAVWLGLGQGGAAAGSTYYPLEFSNVSHHRCRLFGFPGVSARNSRQLGDAATRDGSRPAQSVTLSPGATAHTVLQIVDVFNFPLHRCKPATARDLRVYPPNQRSPTEVPFSFKACSRKGETFLSVQPIRAGVGVPGYPAR